MSIPPIQTGQTSPIIRGAGDQESRRVAHQPQAAGSPGLKAAAVSTKDVFEQSVPGAVDAQKNAQLRRVAAQRQAPAPVQAQPSQTPLQFTGQIEPGTVGIPLPTNPPATQPDSTPDPVPPSLVPPPAPDSTQPVPNTPDEVEPQDEPLGPPKSALDQNLDRLKAAFGLTKGQRGFEANLDLNADGVINGADIANLLAQSNSSQPVQPVEVAPAKPQAVTEGVLNAFGQAVKEGGPNSSYDLNGDGVIDGRDLAQALAQARTAAAEASDSGETKNGPTLEALLSAFGRTTGQKGFSHQVDLNGDGAINGADLAQYLAGLRDDS